MTPSTTAKTAGDQRRSQHTMFEQDQGECAPTTGSDATAPVTSRVGKPQHIHAFTALLVLLVALHPDPLPAITGKSSRTGRTSNVRRITRTRNFEANHLLGFSRDCEFDAAPDLPAVHDGVELTAYELRQHPVNRTTIPSLDTAAAITSIFRRSR